MSSLSISPNRPQENVYLQKHSESILSEGTQTCDAGLCTIEATTRLRESIVALRQHHSLESSPTGQFLSCMGTLSVISGYLSYKYATTLQAVANKIHDVFGKVQSYILQFAARFEMLSGSFSGPRAILEMTGSGKGVATAIAALSLASSIASGVFFVGLGVYAGVALYELVKKGHLFLKLYKTSPDKALTYLQDLLKVTPTERDSLFQKGLEDVKKLPASPAEDLSFLDAVSLSPQDTQAITDYVKRCASLTKEESVSLQTHLTDSLKKAYLRNQKSFVRLFNSKTLERAKALEKTPDTQKANELLMCAQETLLKNITVKSLLLTGALLGTVSSILTTIFTEGLPLLITQVISSTTSSIMVGLDLMSLYELSKESKLSYQEKALLALTTITLIAITVAVNLFSGGLVGDSCMIALGSLLLGCTTLNLYYAQKKEKVHHNPQPV